MQEYEIEVKEVLSRIEKVEADNLMDAIDKVMERYYLEDIVLDAGDFVDVDFGEVESKVVREKVR